MERIGKYLLHHHNEPAMMVRDFKWQAEEHQAILEWKWPTDVRVKLMLVFPLTDSDGPVPPDGPVPSDGPKDIHDIAHFLWWGHEHTVISRTLASGFQATIEGIRQRYMICPAYFNEENTVVVYRPEHVTDWIYKKDKVAAKAAYKPLPLSRYKQVTLDVDLPIVGPEANKALRYGIYENNRLIGIYPLDNDIIEGKYTIHVRKNQEVRFMVDDEFTNRLEIE